MALGKIFSSKSACSIFELPKQEIATFYTRKLITIGYMEKPLPQLLEPLGVMIGKLVSAVLNFVRPAG